MVYESANNQTQEETQPKPLTEADDVRRWLDRVYTSERYRESVSTKHRWETIIKEYGGEYDITLGDIKVPPINEVFAFIQSSISGLYFRDPYIAVNAKRTGNTRGAAILEQAVNYYWRELKTKEEIELEIIDTGLVGHGWHKVGVSVETEGSGDTLKTKSEALYSQRVSWRDMLFNIGTKRPGKDSQWMAQCLVRPLEDVKEKYNVPTLKGAAHPSLSQTDLEKCLYKDDITFVKLYEIWDKKTRRVYLVADGYDKFLKVTEWPEYLDEFPFHMLWYNASPDEAYPISDIEPWEYQILEKNKLFAQALNHVKRWNRQAFIKKGTVSDADLDKFAKGVDGSCLDSTAEDVAASIKFADFGQLPTDIYNLLDRIDQINRTVNGQPEFDKGGVTRTPTRTLGELEMIQSGAKSRTDRKIDRVETHLESIARHLIAHMKGNFDLEKVVKITGELPEEVIKAFGDNYDPKTKTLSFTADDIQGEYDVEVKAGSTLPLDKQTRMQVIETVLKTIGPIAEAAASSPFLQELVSELLRDYDLTGLKQAFEEEKMAAQARAEAVAKAQSVADAKDVSEIEKRRSQADKLDAETSVMERDMNMPADVAMLLEMVKGGGKGGGKK